MKTLKKKNKNAARVGKLATHSGLIAFDENQCAWHISKSTTVDVHNLLTMQCMYVFETQEAEQDAEKVERLFTSIERNRDKLVGHRNQMKDIKEQIRLNGEQQIEVRTYSLLLCILFCQFFGGRLACLRAIIVCFDTCIYTLQVLKQNPSVGYEFVAS